MEAQWEPVLGHRRGTAWVRVGQGVHRPADIGSDDPFLADLRAWATALPAGSSWLLHVLCEVPVQPQAELVDVHGDFVGRADLLISGTRTAHEFDGATT